MSVPLILLLLLVLHAKSAKPLKLWLRIRVNLIKHDDLVVHLMLHKVLDTASSPLLDVLNLHKKVMLLSLPIELEITVVLK